jgi:hypothetical protein
MSAYANPIVLNPQNSAIVLERIPLTASGEAFSEKWLQEALFAYPQCLPIKELDPQIGQLIPICMEIETGAGPADILYVTETGHLVLVETKLWRNPEARRVVVAQILDYAKQLTSWTYTDLARETAIATKQGPDYLLNCVRKVNPSLDEADFIDGVTNSLKSGDFLLLIVGDGIRTGTESLVNFIEQYGNLRFGFGLVEIAAFRLPNNEMLLQPRILAKTEILQRTILVGPAGVVAIEEIAKAEDVEIDDKLNSQREWYQDFWSGYKSKLTLDDLDQPIPSALPKSTNIYFLMPMKTANESWISAYVAQSSQMGGVYLTFSKSCERAQEYYERLLTDREDIEKTIGTALNWENNGQKIYVSAPSINYSDLNNPTERIKVQEYLAEMTNRMINAFRHRLDSYAKEEK